MTDPKTARIEALTVTLRAALDNDPGLPVRDVLAAVKAAFQPNVETPAPAIIAAVREAAAGDETFTLDDGLTALRGAMDAVPRRHMGDRGKAADPASWVENETPPGAPRPSTNGLKRV